MPTEKLQPSCIYHVYNHGNAFDLLFESDENKRYFLYKYNQYIAPICETYAYCLMPNHFHFLLRVRPEEELDELALLLHKPVRSYTSFVNQRFSNFFNAYAKAFNKMYDRRGALFLTPYKRKFVDSDDYLQQLIVYIHRNPVHHGFVKNPADWSFSSYHNYIAESKGKVHTKTPIALFGGAETVKKAHAKTDWSNFSDLTY